MGTYEHFNSQLLYQTIDIPNAIPNELITISFTYRNNGTPEWMGFWRPSGGIPDPVVLKSINGFTSTYVADRVNLNEWIKPVGYSGNFPTEKTFSLQFRAPNVVGIHQIQFRLYVTLTDRSNGDLRGQTLPFGQSVNITLNIQPLPDSELVSLVFPDTMELAQRGTAIITLKNTGIWPWNSQFRIDAYNADALKFSKSYFYIPISETIEPGEEYTFRIPIRGPETSGTYNPCYRLWWSRCGNFGTNVCKQVIITMPTKPIQNLNDYRWISMSARRSTADIAWQYDVQLSGTDKPPVFGKLIHEEDGHCALYGEPTEYSIDYDYPSITTSVACYSYGYFLNNRLPWNLRQSRAGADIRPWQMTNANISAIQGRLDKIDTFENPSDYVKRILFYVNDSTGAIDETRCGPYGLWASANTIKPVPNWGIAAGDGRFNIYHPTAEEPAMIEKRQFAYDGDKIIDVLDEICEHCHMIYFTRFVKVNGVWREYFYFIPKYGVQLGWLGVSTTPIQITPTSFGLVGSPGLSASIVLEQSYNSVWVEACRKKDSAWFYSYKAGRGVLAGTEVPRTLFYRTHDLLPDPAANTWTSGIGTGTNFGPSGVNYGNASENANCQALADAKAQQLVDLLDYRIPTYTATFKGVYFELYQIVIFNGFAGLSEFNGFEMQIIDIEYNYESADNGGHSVTITCAPRDELQKSGKFQSVIDEIQENFEKLKQDIEGKNTDDKVAVVLSTYDQGSMCNAQLRSTGALVKTRTYGYRTASG